MDEKAKKHTLGTRSEDLLARLRAGDLRVADGATGTMLHDSNAEHS